MTSDDERLDRDLAALDRGARDLAWRDTLELKRAARRRQVRQRSALVAAVVAAGTAVTVVATLLVSGPAARAREPQVHIAVVARLGPAAELAAKVGPAATDAASPERAAVATAEQAFAVRLLQQVSRASSGNVTVSPVSLAAGLTMLENGARGATQTQIAETLGAHDLSQVAQDEGWAALVSSLTRGSSAATASLESADSLWVQKGMTLRPAFMAAMSRYFATGVWQADFAHDLSGTQQAIDQWVRQHTNGKITQLFGPGDINQSTVAVLANAVHFLAAWQTPFDPASSEPGSFSTSQGRTVTVTYMHRAVQHAAITGAYQAVQLPYAGGRFAAVAIMPQGQSLAGFIDSLTPSRLGGIAAAASRGPGAQLSLPGFTTQSYLDLGHTLAAMGMPTAFTPAADFTAMSPTPLQVQSVVQRDYLSVGEKGTEAAAATGISVVPTVGIAGPAVTFDHPFLFLIRDTHTGTVLFASVVQEPTTTPCRAC